MPNVAVFDVIADVAQIVRKAPDPTLIAAYVRAARKFCRESRWLRSTLPGQTEAGTSLYNLGSDQVLEIVGLKAASAARTSGNTTAWPLHVSATTTWPTGTRPSHPTRYAYVPEGQIALYPTPDAVYDLTVTLVLQPTKGTNSIPESLLVKWDQALQDGALGYLLDIPDQPWTDPLQAERRRRAFQAAINNARADEQREYNAGVVVARKRPFIVGRV
jgi:hypothetical protein